MELLLYIAVASMMSWIGWSTLRAVVKMNRDDTRVPTARIANADGGLYARLAHDGARHASRVSRVVFVVFGVISMTLPWAAVVWVLVGD